jgi:hypothetical protein
MGRIAAQGRSRTHTEAGEEADLMALCTFKRTLGGLAPADETTAERIRRWNVGELMQADIKLRSGRSNAWHRRYWALCSLVHQNSEDFKSAQEVHLWLKLECGHTKDMLLRSTGEIVKVADSIAFDKMDATAWAAYWQRVVAVVHEHVLPGIDIASLENEIAQIAS